MHTNEIIASLESERDKIDAAIVALRGARRPGRPAGTTNRVNHRRKMSPEARRKISEAAKRRWAKVKAAS